MSIKNTHPLQSPSAIHLVLYIIVKHPGIEERAERDVCLSVKADRPLQRAVGRTGC
jgi:hypothetical protein